MQSVVSKHEEGEEWQFNTKGDFLGFHTGVYKNPLQHLPSISFTISASLSLSRLHTHLIFNHSIHDGTVGTSNTISLFTVRSGYTLPDRIPDRRDIRQPSRRWHFQQLLHRLCRH